MGFYHMSFHSIPIYEYLITLKTFKVFSVICIDILHHKYIVLTFVITVYTLQCVRFCDFFTGLRYFTNSVFFFTNGFNFSEVLYSFS